MNQQQKIAFIKELSDTISLEIINKIMSGQIPERWGGKELRAYFADKADEAYSHFHLRGQEAGNFEHEKVENNL